jgi:hypothetical protein
MAATHRQLMRFANRLNNAETEFELRLYEPIFTRLVRTYVSQVDALKRYRSKNESGLTVQTRMGAKRLSAMLRTRPGLPGRTKPLLHLSSLPIPN